MALETGVKREHGKDKVVTELLYALCSLHAGKDRGKTANLYAISLSILGSLITPSMLTDEFRLLERIQKRLARQHRERDAVTFMELYQRLSFSSGHVITHRTALLSFLLTLSSEDQRQYKRPIEGSLLLDDPGLSSGIELSTSRHPSPSTHTRHLVTPAPGHSSTMSSAMLTGSSGIGSMSSRELSATVMPHTHSSLSATTTTPYPQFASTPATAAAAAMGTNHHHPLLHRRGKPLPAWSEIKSESSLQEGVVSKTRRAATGGSSSKTEKSAEQDVELIEAALLRDLIFVFQNIDGEYITFNKAEDAFRISDKAVVSPSVRELCHKLTELGWLHRKIRKFIDSKTRDKSQGLVCQSFCSALCSELTEYYRLIAVLEAQQAQTEPSTSQSALTLRRLAVWTHDPRERLKMLGVLVDGCKSLKGGALVSSLYAYSQHGDPAVKSLLSHLLYQVYQPLNKMMNCWIFDGELVDKSLEFFIACDVSSKLEKLWRSKYTIRQSMLPSFISNELAQKILIIGKSINFLRQSCQDHTQLGGSTLRTWYLNEEGQCTFDSMTGPALQSVVSTTYHETSKHLLHVLNTKYNFMDHLKALRRYLLLGQGDFVRHLMDLLAPELSKPATVLFLHNLSGTLETAVRATNAQYEDTDILNRLDVRKLDLSPGDQGWDVFSLHYHVDGPISTVFTAEAMLKYLRVFNFLWRAKRMEYCLANMWRDQTAYDRSLQTIAALKPVLHQCHLLVSTMVHFITQLQYYITFEVMECCWARMLKKVEAAKDLDQVIDAHDLFLEQITTQCLLDTESQPILTRLRAIFDLIIMFQQKQSAMFSECLEEAKKREESQLTKDKRTKEGQWGTTARENSYEDERRRTFAVKNMSTYRSEFLVLQESFKDLITEFMGQLNSHTEQSLRFLRFRLDFNEYYTTSFASATPLSM